MMPWSGYMAATAVALAVVTFALGWSKVPARGRLVLAGALAMGTVLAYIPWRYQSIRSTLPTIHDITTDTVTPPAFVAVLPARAAEGRAASSTTMRSCPPRSGERILMSRPSRPRCRWQARSSWRYEWLKQCQGGPLLRSMLIPATSRRGSRAAGSGSPTYIVIRIASSELGSRIDMRSTSRQGRSDYGVNAARVRAYMTALRKRLG